MNTSRNRSTTMNLIHEDLARAHTVVRLGEAHQLRQGRLARAHRLTRRAQLAAQQARHDLARAL
jgi:hypothetical protein